MVYRVGFASIDGVCIDQHFGAARYWQIYDIDEAGTFVETRKTAARCAGRCEGGFSHLLEALRDCSALFVSRIGENAAAVMIANHIRVFEAQGTVEDIIDELVNGNWLEGEENDGCI